MENKELDKVTAFDTLFTTNHIQMYKVLLSYMPPSLQKTLAIYIKFSELMYTVSFLREHPDVCMSCSGIGDERNVFDELMPYLSPSGRESADRMKNMMHSMKNMQEMMEMMQMMQELFPAGSQDGSTDGTSSNGSPFEGGLFSALAGMSGMDMDPSFISQMMQMFSSMDMTTSADMSASMGSSADSSSNAPEDDAITDETLIDQSQKYDT